MKVRGNGSIVQLDKNVSRSKCRRWQLHVSLGRDLATGRYPQRTRRIIGTYSEAQSALRAFIAEIEAEGAVRDPKMPFGSYADAWLAEREAKGLAYDTLQKDACHIRCAKMHLGHARLSEVTPHALEAMYRKLQDGESPSGRPLSGTYVNGIAVTLYRMFRDAVKDQHAPSNPCDYADRPSCDTKERKALRIDGIRAVVQALDPAEPSQLVVRAAVRSGMRRGEVVGLDVGDLDFQAGIIRLRHGTDSRGRRKDTKTEGSERDLPMTPQLRADFKARIERIQEDFRRVRDATGLDEPTLSEDTPLICNELGERMRPHSVTRWWERNRERLGFEDYTIHDMRHSYLSEMARRKTDRKVLQGLAGHARYSTTEDIYVHVEMEDKQQAVEAADW